ncbi:MAG TPA: hypothetical protein VN426_05420 [Syntrophomonadaceae bacterium]|nr:hypothetical protein [Syntrophomonadaceae bacterium]
MGRTGALSAPTCPATTGELVRAQRSGGRRSGRPPSGVRCLEGLEGRGVSEKGGVCEAAPVEM